MPFRISHSSLPCSHSRLPSTLCFIRASYANFIAGNVLFFYRGQRVVFYCGQRVVFIAGNVLFLLGQRVVPLPVPEGGADSSGTHSPTKKSRRNGNYCRAAN
jgi:hypothetical protein